jgi:ABC-type phosphate/phosphonate transport system permease subunit
VGGWRDGDQIVFFACPLAWPLAFPLLFAAVSLSRAWKVRAMVRTLLTSRTIPAISYTLPVRGVLSPCHLLPGKTIQMKFMKK